MIYSSISLVENTEELKEQLKKLGLEAKKKSNKMKYFYK